MPETYCPFESLHQLLMTTGGVEAILIQHANRAEFEGALQTLENAAAAWIAEIAEILDHESPPSHTKTVFAKEVVEPIQSAHAVLTTSQTAQACLPQEAFDWLDTSVSEVNYYLKHWDEIAARLKESADSKAKLETYFSDLLVPVYGA